MHNIFSTLESRVLNVPYLVQPTPITCQSTCLKMFAMYLAKKRQISSPAAEMAIQDIWNDINKSQGRPSPDRNAYVNMCWWLNKHFAPTKFDTHQTKNNDEAVEHVIGRIDADYPVMVSTNHSNTAGHIILVVGYEGYARAACTDKLQFVCHDPYGKFNPKLGSTAWGNAGPKKLGRYSGGACLIDGSEAGPGRAVRYDREGIKRLRKDKHSSGTYFMISAKT